MTKQSQQFLDKASTVPNSSQSSISHDEQVLTRGTQVANYISSPQASPPNAQTILSMQSVLGNQSTAQLMRKHQANPTGLKNEKLKPYSFGGLRMKVQREPHALEQIESTAPDAEKPSQGIETDGKLTPVYAKAWEIAWTEFKPKVEDISKQLKGSTAQVAPLKGRERAGEKAKSDYGGDTASLVDIARGSIVCLTAADALKAFDLVKSTFKIARVKNRFANPAGGYRDLMLNVKLSNGHVAELQIHLKAIIDAKEIGHKDYEVAREIEAIPEAERSDEQKEKLEKAKASMQLLYDEAWEKAKSIPDQ